MWLSVGSQSRSIFIINIVVKYRNNNLSFIFKHRLSYSFVFNSRTGTSSRENNNRAPAKKKIVRQTTTMKRGNKKTGIECVVVGVQTLSKYIHRPVTNSPCAQTAATATGKKVCIVRTLACRFSRTHFASCCR